MDHEREPDLLPMTATPALPTFDLALRGYDRRQVDEYLDRIEHDLAVAQADRDAASARIAASEKRLKVLDSELEAVREQLTESARPTYAGLGKRVEQLLSIAEEEAERLRADAARVLEDEREAAGDLLNEAQRRAEKADRELTAELAVRRREGEKQELAARAELDKRLTAAEKRIADAEIVADTRIAGAQTEADRLISEATTRAERLRTDAEQHAAVLVQAARHDVERIAVEAKAEAGTIIAEARVQAEQGRIEHDREIAELIRRRQDIHSQLKTLRQVLGTLPDEADDDNDAHPTLVTPPVDVPDRPTGPAPDSAHGDRPRPTPRATPAGSPGPKPAASPAVADRPAAEQPEADASLRKTGT